MSLKSSAQSNSLCQGCRQQIGQVLTVKSDLLRSESEGGQHLDGTARVAVGRVCSLTRRRTGRKHPPEEDNPKRKHLREEPSPREGSVPLGSSTITEVGVGVQR